MGSLEQEVGRFREWASLRGGHSGEWETEYDKWPALLAAAQSVLSGDTLSQTDVGLLLFVIARDNECEKIRDMLEQHPENGIRVAKAAVAHPDYQARWQVADFLGTQASDGARALLRQFVTDRHEYVRRRALLASSQNDPEFAEATATDWLSSEGPYSRLAALTVLHEVGSKGLASAIERLRDDPADFVRAKVRELAEAV